MGLNETKVYNVGPIVVPPGDKLREAHRKYMASLLDQGMSIIQPEGRTCACNRCPHAAWCKGN